MKKNQSFHAQRINALGRIIGIIFLIGGFVIGICGIAAFSDAKTESSDAWIVVIMSFIVAVLGVFLLKAKPYPPRDSKNNDHNSR